MPEQFVYSEDRSDPVSWAFIETLVGIDKRFFEELTTVNDKKFIAIELKFNGHEASFSQIIKQFSVNFNSIVEERAKEMLNERAAELVSKMQDLNETLKREVDRLFPDED